ncbi:GH24731 [Drosophila grimshawi]|uniref:GH24731 n=1 Tax=Drosophila grimshawi TaxID=7222 RepID=B4JN16_DROGR|nr:GH24731 [Drosophila grimshawi]
MPDSDSDPDRIIVIIIETHAPIFMVCHRDYECHQAASSKQQQQQQQLHSSIEGNMKNGNGNSRNNKINTLSYLAGL